MIAITEQRDREQEHMSALQIAIDGPVAAGKGDIAARLAKELGFLYIYTGAMYRALALACIQKNIPFEDSEKVFQLLQHSSIELDQPELSSEYSHKVLLNGVDVTERITHPDAAMGASDVGKIAQVREYMVKRQKKMAQGKSVVMEGRDIGLRVLPNSFKIYLTASVDERARRRWEQFKSRGVMKTYGEVLEDTKKRDEQDMTRETDPLQKLPDAWELDTTHLSQDQVVASIKQELSNRGLL